ncbi:hypothetical protein A3G55_00035 [Candidatus Giovannonibacteria bacterium RIFCSPLOWO2_12_FULL_44_25]|uniref:Uncharacterized protein n=3 Tax=Candidatus Giovannoniibacteriota TaxID=1752738 RepID=A0A0G1IER0_9BACT|nr:MAG: hypothetical protein UW15_C0013G0006 [Parcubacteria group bacterium GW2011_GWC1_44_10]KKT57318.1 MAG: hypothetical protein UW49_C0005G0006 [Candidatus Giovannonibacteria bacterium GW2011_GWB1_44_23]KKT59666.1 MAG: hypothetical protein UW53_C0009G0006 [Candidatus Giovannonibacteria bacterium GW2011_GWA1_44_25]OGF50042.1 MAG: hypothetical protein A2120_02845 [Candidatus Giovannonibacteria bacterium GWA2_45_15]OGF59123.1 MAG: hypothetical protein A2W40_01180 [Candidatus Giovannonibacteria 
MKSFSWFWFTAAIAVLLVFAAILLWMGRVPICKCGYVKLWQGVVVSSENSQHLSDWYSFSHIIHGFIFYWFFWRIGRKRGWSLGLRFLLALFVEVGWEIFENTDFTINRYRETTISLDYYGDSVINSVFDALFMVLGFWMAWRMPMWTIVLIAIGLELFVGYYIRDNLALNIIMLIYPFKAILRWQGGG